MPDCSDTRSEEQCADGRTEVALQVLQSLSHKLRSPLGAITNYAYLLKSELEDAFEDVGLPWIDRIESAARRARALLSAAERFLDAALRDAVSSSFDLRTWVATGLEAAPDPRERGPRFEIRRASLEELPMVRASGEAMVDFSAALRELASAMVPHLDPVPLELLGDREDRWARLHLRILASPQLPPRNLWTRPFEAHPGSNAAYGAAIAIMRYTALRQGGDLSAGVHESNPCLTLRLRVAEQG